MAASIEARWACGGRQRGGRGGCHRSEGFERRQALVETRSRRGLVGRVCGGVVASADESQHVEQFVGGSGRAFGGAARRGGEIIDGARDRRRTDGGDVGLEDARPFEPGHVDPQSLDLGGRLIVLALEALVSDARLGTRLVELSQPLGEFRDADHPLHDVPALRGVEHEQTLQLALPDGGDRGEGDPGGRERGPHVAARRWAAVDQKAVLARPRELAADGEGPRWADAGVLRLLAMLELP